MISRCCRNQNNDVTFRDAMRNYNSHSVGSKLDVSGMIKLNILTAVSGEGKRYTVNS